MPSSWGRIEKRRKESEAQPSLKGRAANRPRKLGVRLRLNPRESRQGADRAGDQILSASLCIALGLCGLATSRDWFREDFHAKARRRQDDWQKAIDWQVGAAKTACPARGGELKKGAKQVRVNRRYRDCLA